ncbi:phosphatidate cytidylyltransferase [Sphingomonas sp.]|uniref:phosphatidate cytidylyltransferase n=1 Tax=Sphingomonas sp. TaxID=28214 RepID=UPI0025F8CBE8|nr:phosphatidate cytidylyltransferase [Sphingomonas sp.]MBV9527102.1 phosphatidate cytidylyltransferase [Sphingomonas sp.]
MSELAVRTLSGLVLIATALIAAVVGGDILAVLAAVVAVAMFYEWRQISRGWGPAWSIGGFFYALLPALALLWIRQRTPLADPTNEGGLALLVWVFIVTWSTDIGAYFVGRAIGGRKLAPSISPGKTVAGLYGGIAVATVLGTLWVFTRGLGYPLIVLAPILAGMAQCGDLFESWMKRRAGVKDSGKLLPGHGGILDRLDGFVPVVVLTAAAQLAGLT